jgi:hypothetical protein
LAGPCNLGADRIVIWVTSLERVDGILRALADYQATHRAFFADGIPRLCKEASQAGGKSLRGVGLGVEPGGGLSFGKSRTMPLFEVVDDVLTENPAWKLKGDQGKTTFLERATSELRKRGIDPSRVHL